MLTEKQIIFLFERMNNLLSKKGELGEVVLVGGAVMCLVYHARPSTKDVDAIFEPSQLIRSIAEQIAEEEGLSPDWLNDAAKGFLQAGFTKQSVLELSNLRIWAPEPRYMLAMKCISARWDTSDRDDVIFLINLLKIKEPSEVFSIIEEYYPQNVIPSKTQFLIEEVLEKKKRD